ncbi:MAG: Gfo/Idh/MocA family oxidoreductase [Alistipes sp.]|nr:Gfo/Idh/MocA family oxidoreductase [Alistipes sp.]
MKKIVFMAMGAMLALAGCQQAQTDAKFSGRKGEVKLLTLDPGHFHAALVQMYMYDEVDPTVWVYAPEGDDVQMHLDRVNIYNTRSERPTSWNEQLYTGKDFLQKMVEEQKGNVVVLAGNNGKKTSYVKAAVDAGINVLSDKPMAIDQKRFKLLEQTLDEAAEKGVMVYDIMTERSEINNELQRVLVAMPELFGELQKGTPEDPAITKESVHHFFKYVSGQPLRRPEWYFDVEQQGEGLVDVTTHLVDLVQCTVMPEQEIDYKKDIKFTSAKRWATKIPVDKYRLVSGKESYPDFLKKDIVNDTLHVYSNGEMNYQLAGVNVKVSVVWNFMAKVGTEGTGDTHYSVVKGSKCNVEIRQGAEQGYKPMLYVVSKVEDDVAFEAALNSSLKSLEKRYAGLSAQKCGEKEWQIIIPQSVVKTHEMRFSSVMQVYLDYLKQGEIPAWERSQMKSKYYTTTKAVELARE